MGGLYQTIILNLVKEHGLAYAKLDFSIVSSAYINDPTISGCYATDHPYHRDHEESLVAIYQNALKMFDELHAEAPELFIDCTFETAGKLQLQDYAFAEHAEGNWLSNIEEPFRPGTENETAGMVKRLTSSSCRLSGYQEPSAGQQKPPNLTLNL
jgi:alpha-galactosidase